MGPKHDDRRARESLLFGGCAEELVVRVVLIPVSILLLVVAAVAGVSFGVLATVALAGFVAFVVITLIVRWLRTGSTSRR